MTREKSSSSNIKSTIEALEVSLRQIEEIQSLQQNLRKAYKAPYPIPFKFNLAITVMLYILFKQGMPYGGYLVLVWLGWQICVNGIYFMFKLYRKMPKIAQWKNKININIEELEKNSRIPHKYWHSHAVESFIRYLKTGKAKTIDECVKIYEED